MRTCHSRPIAQLPAVRRRLTARRLAVASSSPSPTADHANISWVYAGPARDEPAAALKRAGAPAAAVESIQWHDVFTPCLERTHPDVCTVLLSMLLSQSRADASAPTAVVIEDLGLLACSAGGAAATASAAQPSAVEHAARRLAGGLIAWAASVPSQVLVHCRATDAVVCAPRSAESQRRTGRSHVAHASLPAQHRPPPPPTYALLLLPALFHRLPSFAALPALRLTSSRAYRAGPRQRSSMRYDASRLRVSAGLKKATRCWAPAMACSHGLACIRAS